MENFAAYDFTISEIVLSTRVGFGQGERFHRNRPSHGLVYMLDGENAYRFDGGNTETVRKGQLFYLPKASNYEVLLPLRGACIAINYLLGDASVTFPFFQLPADASERFENYFTAIELMWRTKPAGYRLRCMSLLYDLLYRLQKCLDDNYLPVSQRARLRSATEYISSRYYASDIKVADLAKTAGVTPEYLRALFRKAYGVPPHQYIEGMKIERAKELLRAGGFPVGEIAALCGYASVGYFCREFKKHTFLTPSEFRKRSAV